MRFSLIKKKLAQQRALYLKKRARAESRNSFQKSIGFSKIVKKSSPLTIGDKGLVLVLGLIITAGIVEKYLKMR